MVDNNAGKYLTASICIIITAGIIALYGFGYEMRTWVKIVYLLISMVSLYPILAKQDEIKNKMSKTLPELMIMVDAVLCEIGYLVMCAVLFAEPSKYAEMLKAPDTAAFIRFVEFVPLILGAFYALHFVNMAFLAITKGRSYKALAVFGCVAALVLWLLALMVNNGTIIMKPWGGIALITLIPGCLRMRTIELYGHI